MHECIFFPQQQAIRRGKLKSVAAWLRAFQPEEMKDKINSIKFNDSSTALHLAAQYNQPEIAKLLMHEGAGTYF